MYFVMYFIIVLKFDAVSMIVYYIDSGMPFFGFVNF